MRENNTSIQGRLRPEIVKRIVRANFPRMRACYERAVERRGEAFRGNLAIDMVIGPDGVATSARASLIDTTIDDEEMLRCVELIFACFTFPPPDGGRVGVHYPIDFSAHPLIDIEGPAVHLWRRIEFDDKEPSLAPSAQRDLDALAEFLLTTGKNIELLDIEVHAEVGSEESASIALTIARAKAIVEALVARGVERKRLRGTGYGALCDRYIKVPSRPSANERVELVITKRGGQITDAKFGCPAAAAKGLVPDPKS